MTEDPLHPTDPVLKARPESTAYIGRMIGVGVRTVLATGLIGFGLVVAFDPSQQPLHVRAILIGLAVMLVLCLTILRPVISLEWVPASFLGHEIKVGVQRVLALGLIGLGLFVAFHPSVQIFHFVTVLLQLLFMLAMFLIVVVPIILVSLVPALVLWVLIWEVLRFWLKMAQTLATITAGLVAAILSTLAPAAAGLDLLHVFPPPQAAFLAACATAIAMFLTHRGFRDVTDGGGIGS